MSQFQEQLIEQLPRLRRFCRALARAQSDADDLAQATVERALVHRTAWQPGSRLDSWLFRIAQNLWRDELRAHRRRAEPLDDQTLAGEDGRDSLPRHIEAHEVIRAFNALPEEQRTVLLLVVLEGMRYQEAADTLGVPVGTVMSRLARARGRLAAGTMGDPQRLRAAKK
jgi:RNA polymerase sigma-70 factor (ECF subfamily)